MLRANGPAAKRMPLQAPHGTAEMFFLFAAIDNHS
jgi:hypothetical protein